MSAVTSFVMLASGAASVVEASVPSGDVDSNPSTATAAEPSAGQAGAAADAVSGATSTDCAVGITAVNGQSRVTAAYAATTASTMSVGPMTVPRSSERRGIPSRRSPWSGSSCIRRAAGALAGRAHCSAAVSARSTAPPAAALEAWSASVGSGAVGASVSVIPPRLSVPGAYTRHHEPRESGVPG